MANYPGSKDQLTNPTPTNPTNSPSHADQHATANDILEALENKVGTGATTPSVGSVLYGTGTGTSGWGSPSVAGLQPLDADLTSIASTGTTSLGRQILNAADPTSVRSFAEAAWSQDLEDLTLDFQKHSLPAYVPDPHSMYATDADVASMYAGHVAAADPHSVYATDANLTAHAATPHGGLTDHTHATNGAQGGLALTPGSLLLPPAVTSPALLEGEEPTQQTVETDEGSITWESTQNVIRVGTGSGFMEYGGLSDIAPQPLGTASAGGNGWQASRYTHVHAHGTIASGNLHPEYATDADLTSHVSANTPHTTYDLDPSRVGTAFAGSTNTAPSRGDHAHPAFGDTPTTAAFSDAASRGASSKAAQSDHVHGMPANPVTAHEAAGDPHTGYQQESGKGVANGYASLDSGILVPIAQLPTGTSGTTVALGNHAHAGTYEPAGTVSTHAAAADPHTGYRLESADHSHASTGLQAGQVAHSALSGVTADQHHAQSHAMQAGVGLDHTCTTTAGHVFMATASNAASFQPLTDAQIPATIARDTEVTAAVTAHVAGDPHAQYQLESEKDAANGYPGLNASGQLVRTGGGNIRVINVANTFGAVWFIDGTQSYLLLTDSGDPTGAINSLRPFTVNLATGQVTMSNGVVLGANSPLTVSNKASLQYISGGGTSFPAGQANNDRYYRTDLDMEFFWDGTRWLSTQLFEREIRSSEQAGVRIQPYAASAVSAMRGGLPPWSFWVDRLTTGFYVSAGGTALSGSHKWDMAFSLDPSTTPLVTQTVSSGSSGVWRQIDSAIGLVVPATDYATAMSLTKTGTPGDLRAFPTLYYRRIAT